MKPINLLVEAYRKSDWAIVSGAIAVFLFGFSLQAFNSKYLSLDLRVRNLSGATLSNKDIRHADLQGADLSGADLSGADLREANLANARLQGADLREAKLAGAIFRNADLSRANLTDAVGVTGEQIGVARADGAVLPAYLPAPAKSGARNELPTYEFNELLSIRLSYLPYKVALTPDGSTVLSVGRETKDIHRWRIEDERRAVELAPMKGQRQDGRSIVVSPDGQLVASGSDDGAIRLWKIEEDEPLKLLRDASAEGYVFNLDFSKDGQSLVSASRSLPADQKTVSTWQVNGAKEVSKIRIRPTEIILDVNSDRKLMVIRTPPIQGAQLRSITDNTIVRFLEGSQQEITSGAFSYDGQVVALGIKSARDASAARGSPEGVGGVLLWRVQDGQAIGTPLIGPGGSTTGMIFSPDGGLVVAGWSDGSIQIWRAGDGFHLPALSAHDEGVRNITFSADGRTLASAGTDRIIRLWRVTKKQ